MLDACSLHLHFCQSLHSLQHGLSAIADLLVLFRICKKNLQCQGGPRDLPLAWVISLGFGHFRVGLTAEVQHPLDLLGIIYIGSFGKEIFNVWLWAAVNSLCRSLVRAVKCCRSSPTGEGLFIFSSYQNELIYQTVHRASTVIAEAMRIARANSEVWHQCSFKRQLFLIA